MRYADPGFVTLRYHTHAARELTDELTENVDRNATLPVARKHAELLSEAQVLLATGNQISAASLCELFATLADALQCYAPPGYFFGPSPTDATECGFWPGVPRDPTDAEYYGLRSVPERCQICRRPLNDPADPASKDCGGDCLGCMAEAGDSDCILALVEIVRKKASS